MEQFLTKATTPRLTPLNGFAVGITRILNEVNMRTIKLRRQIDDRSLFKSHLILSRLFLSPKGNAMLVLSRKNSQSIIIDSNIQITVLGVHNGRVRLGIDAPKEISIQREEVAAAIRAEQHENRFASTTSVSLPVNEGDCCELVAE